MDPSPDIPPERQVWPNRTLNLRSMRAIGYDMDYTLVPYRTDEWERAAFEHAIRLLADRGWPVEGLRFDPGAVTQGLVFDLELGNLVKSSRFGRVIRACHGTRLMEFGELREAYSGTSVDLSEPRWEFTNTMFSLSQSSLYGQLVDHLDAGVLPGVVGYGDLYAAVGQAIDHVHVHSELKPEILGDPDRFIDPDPEVAQTLIDQRAAGKLTLLITNSDWEYTKRVMHIAVGPFVPGDGTWRDLFDLVIVSARKPGFFTSRHAVFRLVDDETGLLQPHYGRLERGGVYVGGDAPLVEQSFGIRGDEILYVGDHLFGDVHVTKITLRWRTALIVNEIEDEIREAEEFADTEQQLVSLMGRKEALERRQAVARLQRLRGDDVGDALEEIGSTIRELDDAIAPLAKRSGELTNALWGPIMRAGIDKSIFARQVERYADVYTSRASNLGLATPYAYLRAPRSDLPHDHRSVVVGPSTGQNSRPA
ncbi:MAG: HAD-IG family 5'-nucleotidase [Thermoleophilia bacterium]|nr:HAD-IG family 5'-nucleotidase [Thermoleophilia bacterium]